MLLILHNSINNSPASQEALAVIAACFPPAHRAILCRRPAALKPEPLLGLNLVTPRRDLPGQHYSAMPYFSSPKHHWCPTAAAVPPHVDTLAGTGTSQNTPKFN